MTKEDLYDNLVISGGSGFIISHGFKSLVSLGLDAFSDVILVNSFDPDVTVGMAFEVSRSGFLPTIFISSLKLPDIYHRLYRLDAPFPVLLGVTELCDSLGMPYCKLDKLCNNAAKAASVAITTKGPVILFV